MDLSSRNIYLKECETINSFDFVEFFKTIIPTHSIEEIKVVEITALDFIKLVKRSANQLKSKLESEDYIFMIDYVPGTNIKLTKCFSDYKSYLVNKNLNGLFSFLKEIIWYQMSLGFWDIKIVNDNYFDVSSKIIELESYEKEIKIDLGNLKKSLEEQSKSFSNTKLALENTLNTFNTNLSSISNSLKNAQSEEKSISLINNSVSDINGRLNAILDTQSKELEHAKVEIKKLETSNEAYDKKIKYIEKQSEDIEENLNKIKENEKRVDEITGLISNKVLVYSFANRAKSLSNITIAWGIGIFISFIISIFWLMFAFVWNDALSNLFKDATNQTNIGTLLVIIASALKIFPVWLLMQFVFKNYSKERHLWEAYEFKAAVAATVKSYADQMINERYALKRTDFASDLKGESEWNKYVDHRDEYRKALIKETVENLYREIKFNEADAYAKKLAKQDWKKFKDIMSFMKDTSGAYLNTKK